MQGIIHQFLKWMPFALATLAIGASAVWEVVRDAIANMLSSGWTQMSDPIIAACAVLAIIAYVAAIILTADGKQKPKLKGYVDQIISNNNIPEKALKLENADRRWCWILINIRNLGAPSFVGGWQVYFKPKGLARVKCDLFVLPEETTLLDNRGGGLVLKAKEHSLPNLCMTPIPSGGISRGWLHFMLPKGVSYAGVGIGDQFIVQFADVTGKTYQVKYISGLTSEGGIRWFPGAGDGMAM